MILRPRHFRAIELLAGTDLRQWEVARRVGVSRRTLGHWLKKETFRAELARRRELLPCRLNSLRLHTARMLLVHVLDRLKDGEERLPIKEMTQLLARLAGDDLESDKTEATASEPPEAVDDVGGQTTAGLTSEQAEEIWAKIDEYCCANEEAARRGEPVEFAPAAFA